MAILDKMEPAPSKSNELIHASSFGPYPTDGLPDKVLASARPTSRITYREVQTLEVDLPVRSTEQDVAALFEDIIRILRGKNPTWRIEYDAGLRSLQIHMSSVGEEYKET